MTRPGSGSWVTQPVTIPGKQPRRFSTGPLSVHAARALGLSRFTPIHLTPISRSSRVPAAGSAFENGASPVWAPGWAGGEGPPAGPESSASADEAREEWRTGGPSWLPFPVKPGLWTLDSYLPGLSNPASLPENQDVRTGWLPCPQRPMWLVGHEVASGCRENSKSSQYFAGHGFPL